MACPKGPESHIEQKHEKRERERERKERRESEERGERDMYSCSKVVVCWIAG